ncbi:MAG: GGDEF domain-containing protein [Microcoleaceae cyanobacterium MO_207.B10]|nr:GGDEF domain-containing protein [Microcoleaceae cyanobacterium MO_207.B10]
MKELAISLEEQKELSAELESLATTDTLTNIYNRRRILEIAEQEFARSVRYQNPFSILMIDIDKFKIINDSYGHQIGDEVIIKVTKEISDQIRNMDAFGRFGGDEFMIFLPETNLQNSL